jgi:general secretion pathway protein G
VAEKRLQRSVFFPWERKTGLLGALRRARTRAVLWVLFALVLVVVVRRREEHAAAVRSTRATIGDARHALMTWRADHENACPHDLAEVSHAGYVHDAPIDAWGRPLRLQCPGRKDPKGFEVWSDGPDGVPGGLDRVE